MPFLPPATIGQGQRSPSRLLFPAVKFTPPTQSVYPVGVPVPSPLHPEAYCDGYSRADLLGRSCDALPGGGPAGGRAATPLGSVAGPGRLAAPAGLLNLLRPDRRGGLSRARRLPVRLGGRIAGRLADLPGLRGAAAGRRAAGAAGALRA